MKIQEIPNQDKRSILVAFRLTAAERQQLRALVQREGRSASELIRAALLERKP